MSKDYFTISYFNGVIDQNQEQITGKGIQLTIRIVYMQLLNFSLLVPVNIFIQQAIQKFDRFLEEVYHSSINLFLKFL